MLDGRVVGKVTLDTAYPPYAELVNLLVHPEYRGRGIGGRLVEECLRPAEAMGFTMAMLMLGVARVDALTPRGVVVKEGLEDLARVKLRPGEDLEVRIRFRVSEGFNIPRLSFSTLVVSLAVHVKGLEEPIVVSGGFERS